MPATSPTLSPTLSATVPGFVRVVLGQVLHYLARQVDAHVGGLGVDAAGDGHSDEIVIAD